MSAAFDVGASVTLPASANMADDDDAYLVVGIDANGQVAPRTAANQHFVGVTRAPATSSAAGSAIEVVTSGLVTVRSSGAFAASASLVPAAGGKVGTRAAAATDRFFALEAATGADQLIRAVIV